MPFPALFLNSIVTHGGSLPSLQTYHPPSSPSRRFRDLAKDLIQVKEWDVYGDFDKDDASYLRDFERELAQECGMENAVFMPSGGMAQSIALCIHGGDSFACHPTCHVLLHEQDAYKHLLRMHAIEIHSQDPHEENCLPLPPPLLYKDVRRVLDAHKEQKHVETLILELPHREIGGQLTPWSDILDMQTYCRNHNIRFHCDGARLFEAAAGYNKTLQELVAPFDSVYISMYKGLGGLAGAVLMGRSKEFGSQARIWLRRWGGNLYTLLPYVAAGRQGYEHYWKHVQAPTLTFSAKRQKMRDIVSALQQDPVISLVVQFNPTMPETSMVHGFLTHDKYDCHRALDQVVRENPNINRALHRMRSIESHEGTYSLGFRTRFEWTLGQANGAIPLEAHVQAWRVFAEKLLDRQS